jgi:hypothetical protein
MERSIAVEVNEKLQLYKEMILYLLKSTRYSLRNIADLSDCSLMHLQSIYLEGRIPENFGAGRNLMRLYQFVLELKPDFS